MYRSPVVHMIPFLYCLSSSRNGGDHVILCASLHSFIIFFTDQNIYLVDFETHFSSVVSFVLVLKLSKICIIAGKNLQHSSNINDKRQSSH